MIAGLFKTRKVKMEYVKPYKLVVRIKNNRLWRAVLELYPEVETQLQAADVCGVTGSRFDALLNMKHWPGRIVREGIRWTVSATQVAKTLGHEPSYLFDPAYYGIKAVEAPKFVEFEVAINEIEQRHLMELPPPAEELAEKLQLESNLIKTMASLTPREEGVLRMRFGIGTADGKEYTLAEVAEKMHFRGSERARQIEGKALRKLRHPWRSRMLRKGLDNV